MLLVWLFVPKGTRQAPHVRYAKASGIGPQNSSPGRAAGEVAPNVFVEGPRHAFVRRRPATPAARRPALQALVCRPTGSIGSRGDGRPRSVMDDFPLVIEDPVHYCGFTSPSPYGGSSYFTQHPAGNWLIDSPEVPAPAGPPVRGVGRRRPHLPDAPRRRGRRPPVRQEVRCRAVHPPGRVALAARRGSRPRRCGVGPAGRRLAGRPDAWPRGGPLRAAVPPAVPVHRRPPGLGPRRTAGGVSRLLLVLLPRQVESMARLADFPLEWVLPGHGRRASRPEDEMRSQMTELVERVRWTGRSAGSGTDVVGLRNHLAAQLWSPSPPGG